MKTNIDDVNQILNSASEPAKHGSMHGVVKPPYRYPFRAWRIGRLLLTWCRQAHGAPIVDTCTSRDAEGNVYKGRTILLTPWRKDKWGDRYPQPAIVVAWRRHNAALSGTNKDHEQS